MTIEIKFDSNQKFQIEAVDAVVDLFKGSSDAMSAVVEDESSSFLFEQRFFSNRLNIASELLLENLREIQSRKRIKSNGEMADVIPENLRTELLHNQSQNDFTIEMETGTGKTYVYLKTIFELYLRYGLSKFVIVVPTVAIREGVISTLRLTKEHFHEVYGGIQYDSYVYDSKNVNRIRQFATSPNLQILIINIAAFNKDDNIIHKKTDGLEGKAPIDFIQAVQPVIIMDEPQKLSTCLRNAACKTYRRTINES